jgi:hypothetical protein
MELKESEKELAIAILSLADGEDVDEIVDKSCFKDYLTRSLILQASDIDLDLILEERKYEKISIV